MALHGDIRVNGTMLGVWSAQRREQLEQRPHLTFRYDCEAMWVGHDRKIVFSMVHRYEEGATVLAAKVLTRAAADQVALGLLTVPDAPEGVGG